MIDFLKLLKRFIPPYTKYLAGNIVFNFLGAIFGVFSFLLIEPVLSILFGIHEEVNIRPEFVLDIDTVRHYFNYLATQLKNTYGAGNTLLYVGLFFVTAAIFKVGFTYLGAISMVYIRTGVVRDIRERIYQKILNLPLPFFTEKKKGDIISRVTNDVVEVENSVMNSLEMFFKNPIIIIIYLVTMIMMSWQMTLFVLLLLPISGFIIGRIGKTLKSQSLRGQQKMGELLSTTEETLSGLRIIKAFNAEDSMQNRFDNENNAIRKIMNTLHYRRLLAHPLSEVLGTLTIVILLWFGGMLILSQKGNLTAPGFIAYLAIFYSIINPAKAITNAFYSIQKGMAAMTRIDSILNTQNPIQEIPNAKTIKEFKHGICFEDVSFSYDRKQDVLKHINLEIKKGFTIALVGQSGAGKTTFVDLLPRFYDISKGRITIDGIDIREFKINDLRNLMGNVNQESILFNDTFANNIAFGINNADITDIKQAAKVANAHNFIIKTPKKYTSSIGERGDKLSGGQRQRISIARAVLKNPPILILDEATSSLDTESEKLVQTALRNLMKDRTSIVIAHRLSTVKNADLICVFKNGEIIERGRHKELLDKDGEYKKLYDLQMMG